MHTSRRPPQDRRMIKYGAKLSLGGRLWAAFFAWLIPALLPWIIGLAPIRFGVINLLIGDFIYGVSLPMFALSTLATVFVTDPITVRLSGYFLHLNRDPQHMPSPLFVTDCFSAGYLRLVLGMLLRSVRLLLWAGLPLLLGALLPGALSLDEVAGYQVIRVGNVYTLFMLISSVLGLYKSLSYAMVPYLLFEHPELSPGEALSRSVYLTRGRIWELFVLQLSFLGWMILVPMTVFIAAIYVYPYLETTMAAYYIAFATPLPYEKPPYETDEA